MKSETSTSLWPDPRFLGTATDLYQLTMMAGYVAAGKDRERATFEVFVRRMPEHRSFLIFAGLEQAISDVLNLAFSPEQIDAIRRWPVFSGIDPQFFDSLYQFRFEGDIWAVPEGTAVFAGQPLVRVVGPLAQAQWVETYLLSALGYPTLVAAKAARVVEAAQGRPVYDFGARRGQGPHAGFLAARASYLAGGAGTSHVEAALRLGIPCVGTMAHSWVQSFASESEAFQTFAQVFPQNSTLLVDTYDVDEGVKVAARIVPPVQAVRIDSGDLLVESRKARALLDAHDRRQVRILGSGDLDEFSIDRLVSAGAPIDGFGVGTEMITSRDAPALSLVYKLVELNGEGRFKLSPGKKTYPMAKQIYRQKGGDGRFSCDRITKADEHSSGEPLLRCFVLNGKLVEPFPTLNEVRERCRTQIEALPSALRGNDAKPTYTLEYSDALEAEATRLGVR